MVQRGVDVFDSAYPYVVTKRNVALTFNFTTNSETEVLENSELPPYEIDLSDKERLVYRKYIRELEVYNTE